MGRIADDYATLLDSVTLVEANLARGLLDEAGIPCLFHGPDFDFAELGLSSHAAARGVSVYVPRAALAEAQEVLRAAAWDGGAPPEPA
jgi:hypothetical protein